MGGAARSALPLRAALRPRVVPKAAALLRHVGDRAHPPGGLPPALHLPAVLPEVPHPAAQRLAPTGVYSAARQWWSTGGAVHLGTLMPRGP